MRIINEASSLVSKWSSKLIDDARVEIYDHYMFIILVTGAVCNIIDWHLYKSLFVWFEVMGGKRGSDQTFQMANIFVLHQEMQRPKVDEMPSNKL
jgi:hypothetical protein